VDTSMSQGKSFDISKRELWEAYRRVKANQGAPGVDGQTIEEFETDLEAFLGEVREQLKSRTFGPVEVRQVMIPKASGKLRSLGIPTEAA